MQSGAWRINFGEVRKAKKMEVRGYPIENTSLFDPFVSGIMVILVNFLDFFTIFSDWLYASPLPHAYMYAPVCNNIRMCGEKCASDQRISESQALNVP